jgi:hypothetical protein
MLVFCSHSYISNNLNPISVILGLLVIVAHQQNTGSLWFKVPLVPLIPALSIFFNVELMVHLQALTWVRFIVWMALGKGIHETLIKLNYMTPFHLL